MKNKTAEWSAGDFRTPVTLQVEVDTPDGAGGYTHTWSTVAEVVFCNVQQSNGTETYSEAIGGRLLSQQLFTFTTWWRADIVTVDRILWNGNIWNVRSTYDIDGRNKFLQFTAETGVEV